MVGLTSPPRHHHHLPSLRPTPTPPQSTPPDRGSIGRVVSFHSIVSTLIKLSSHCDVHRGACARLRAFFFFNPPSLPPSSSPPRPRPPPRPPPPPPYYRTFNRYWTRIERDILSRVRHALEHRFDYKTQFGDRLFVR